MVPEIQSVSLNSDVDGVPNELTVSVYRSMERSRTYVVYVRQDRVSAIEQDRDSHQRVCIREMEKLKAAEARVAVLEGEAARGRREESDRFWAADHVTELEAKLTSSEARVAELEHAARVGNQRIRELEATVASLNRSACKDTVKRGEGESDG